MTWKCFDTDELIYVCILGSNIIKVRQFVLTEESQALFDDLISMDVDDVVMDRPAVWADQSLWAEATINLADYSFLKLKGYAQKQHSSLDDVVDAWGDASEARLAVMVFTADILPKSSISASKEADERIIYDNMLGSREIDHNRDCGFKSMGNLLHWLYVYAGIHVSSRCSVGNGIVTLWGKPLVNFQWNEPLQMPIFSVINEEYHQIADRQHIFLRYHGKQSAELEKAVNDILIAA